MNSLEIKNILRNPYNREDWKNLYRNIFQGKVTFFDEPYRYEINEEIVESLLQIGYVTLDDEYIVALFEVNIKSNVNVLSKKIGLRKIITKYISDDKFNGVLTIFENGSDDYRFTFASKTTKVTEDGVFVSETSSKRFTYILGKNEPCVTPSQRFENLLKKSGSINIEDVVDAFSVEKLNKEFFNGYKEHYELLCGYFNGSFYKKIIFNNDDKLIRDFVKKFLGRIVFLYFVQKKGWMGVLPGNDWGSGDHQFLSNLFKSYSSKDKFYSEILHPIFFNYLNIERSNDVVELYDEYFIRIPYLNGGLFEKELIDEKNIELSESYFESLFNYFDRFNFTIYEDDPNEHTVAVDPEMLGHIFENLLEDNKDKGAYYTPKEVVHYMCQESLIEYLTSWFSKNGFNVLNQFSTNNSDQSSLFSENESRVGQLYLQTETPKIINRVLIENLLKKKLLEEDRLLILKYLNEFNIALDKVKICDPAIGSGAYPMGLLHEIFLTKQTLWYFEYGNLNDFPSSEIKLNIIQNSIYGVDIEKGAVDIARLRFWLSLIVDEEEPKSLPNLDYKIVVGNSLVSFFENQIIEIDWNIKFVNVDSVKKIILDQQNKLYQLDHLQHLYFQTYTDKFKLNSDIKKLKIDILKNQLSLTKLYFNEKNPVLGGFIPTESDQKKNNKNKSYLENIDNIINQLNDIRSVDTSKLNYFDWRLNFPEILNSKLIENPGFDIIIGNPPYIDSETMVKNGLEDLRNYLSNKLQFCKGNWDIYIAFFDSSFNLLNNSGVLVFITPDKWISKPFGDELRKGLKDNFHSIAEAGRKVFDNAKVDSIITLITKEKKDQVRIDNFVKGTTTNFSIVDKSTLVEPYTFDWLFSDVVDKINSIDKYKKRFIDYATCENACATSDAYKLKDFIKESDFDKNNHLKIINTGTIGRYESKWGKREMTYLKDKYLYPIVDKKSFLSSFSNSYGAKSILPKIIIKGLTLLDCCIDFDGIIIPGKSTLVITKSFERKNELIFPLALLNSKVSLFYIKEKYRGSSYNQGINFNPDMINNLPIPNIDESTMKKIEDLTIKLIEQSSKGNEIVQFQNELNLIFYKLYELSFEQVCSIDHDFILTYENYQNFINS